MEYLINALKVLRGLHSALIADRANAADAAQRNWFRGVSTGQRLAAGIIIAQIRAAQEAADDAAETEAPDLDESMDGDHESALASAGFGTDEDYGCYGGGDE